MFMCSSNKSIKSWKRRLWNLFCATFGVVFLLFLLLVADQKIHSSNTFDDYEYTHGIPIHKNSILCFFYKQAYQIRAWDGYWANVVVAVLEEPALSLGVKPGSVIVKWGDWTWDPDADFEHGCRAMHHEADRSLDERLTVVWIDDAGPHKAQIGPGGFGVFVKEKVMPKEELSGAFAWINR